MTVVPVESKVPAHPRLYSSGSLDGFKSTTLTPVIGNEFPKGSVNIVDDILNAPNAEQRTRDLAILSMSIYRYRRQLKKVLTNILSRRTRRRLLPRPRQSHQRPAKRTDSQTG